MTLHIANAIVVVTLILKSAGSLHSGHFTPAQEEILPEFHENELFTQQDLHYMEPTDDVSTFLTSICICSDCYGLFSGFHAEYSWYAAEWYPAGG